ncbi:MAG TPA: peptidoglycan DD-metalloendopeptidase family protein, partial [Spirochaetota bacterium]|nr:peptidoglycan DD-metalloendopeptidase family protein [Spirochaetota bacterium]
ADASRRKEILLRLDEYLQRINGFTEKETGVRLTSPLAPDRIQGVEPVTHSHPDEKASEEPLAAYITGRAVRMRAGAGAGSKTISRLDLGEKVSLLEKSDRTDTMNGRTYPWILVRKNDGLEGWVFGAYISRKNPLAGADKKSQGPDDSDSMLDLPSAGKLTSNFGYRVDPVTGEKGVFHSGIDIAAPAGTPVKAAADGTVLECGFYSNGYGNLVVIGHNGGLRTCYGHLSAIAIRKGDIVGRGDVIGSVGSSGRATGTHLHFEVRKGGAAQNPQKYLR